MNTTHIENDDEINLSQVIDFFKRQFKIMILIFTIIFLSALLYAVTMPTLYQSKVSLLVGERMYFLQQQQQLIENIDEIKFIFKDISVTSIKNTRIIELEVTNKSLDTSQQTLNTAVEKIIDKHNDILSKKKSEFTDLLKSVTSGAINKTQLINLLDNASNSNKTKINSPVTTVTMKYSGRFSNIIGIGFIFALLSALFFGLIKDWIEKHYSKFSAIEMVDKQT